MKKVKDQKPRKVRHLRIRAKIQGVTARPRLMVFRSNQHIYAALIDDSHSKTLASVSDKDLKGKETKMVKATKVGEMVAKKAQELKINEVVFDRGGYLYHGRVKNVAEGARSGGLKF